MKILILLLSIFLFACATGPNNEIDLLSLSLERASKSIDDLEKQGFIEDKKEDDLQRKIAFAHSLLIDPGSSLVDSKGYCKGETTRLDCVEAILLLAQSFIPKEDE